MPPTAGVRTFVGRQNDSRTMERGQQQTTSRPSSRPRIASDNAREASSERKRKAESMKFQISGVGGQNLDSKVESRDLGALAVTVAERPRSAHVVSTDQKGLSSFDDTEYDDTLSSGLSTIDGRQEYVTFGTDYNRPSMELIKNVGQEHYEQQRGQEMDQDERAQQDAWFNGGWRAELKTAKKDIGPLQHPGRVVAGILVESYPPPDAVEVQRYEDDVHDRFHTSRPEYKHESMYNPLMDHGEPDEEAQEDDAELITTPSLGQQSPMPVPHAKPPQNTKLAKITTSSLPVTTDKAGSYVESSEEDVPSDQPASKKPRMELDYTPEQLKTITYADLAHQPFGDDPRATNSSSTTPPFDEHGVPLSLARRLANLPKMKESDVRALFSAQKDSEWEETGVWFIKQFEGQMKRFMEARHRRRMIAMKFEMEIKRRQAAVAAKTDDVAKELRELKSGGIQLMGRRASPMK